VASLAFGTVVTMWSVAYVARLPAVMAPSWLLLIVLLVVLTGGGWVAGRRTGRGWRGGALVGATAAVLNMLILGGVLSPADGAAVRPSALLWIPGSIVLGGLLAGVAAAISSRSASPSATPADWLALFAKVAVAATFLLVVAGGLVTSSESGLAVVDWPNTFGYNMFLYPVTRMTGGVYYEHAHRLLGALVGLTTLVLAVSLWRVDRRGWVRGLGVVAVLAVVLQGLLGGLRVTGRFTMSTAPEAMAPNLTLAMVHGITGQIFLALMVAIAVFESRWWREGPPPVARPTASSDRSIQVALVAALVVQLVLGAVQRHMAQGLLIHITLAAVVTALAIAAGARAWGLYPSAWPVSSLGKLTMAVVTVQVVLGIAALAATGGLAEVGSPDPLEVTLATAHQATGALLLVVVVALALWTRRLLVARPPGSSEDG
jgi:cytochrome c oxidase assembly protein subunit 15